MAKRFTDTEKWKRPWFTDLDSKAKLVWLYLLDNCDHAGIWPANFSLAAFCLGFKIDENFLADKFSDKIMKLDHDKFWIKSFFDFQYGINGTVAYKAKVSAANSLMKYGIKFNENMEVLPKTSEDLHKSIGIGTGTGTGTGTVGRESVREKPIQLDFSDLYAKYPKKLGKKQGLRICKNAIKNPEALIAAHKAVERYAEYCRSNKVEPQFIKHFSTFMNSWEDWLDESVGSIDKSVRQKTTLEVIEDYERRKNESTRILEINDKA